MLKLPDHEESYWLDDCTVSTYPELIEGVEVDVAIIGGGISGLTAAYLLKQAGKSVAILEKDTIACGTTGNTTGKVTSQHSIIYTDLYECLSKKTARLYGQANEFAIEQIEKLIKKEKIECDWQRTDNFVYTRDSSQVEKFKQEAKIAKKIGLPATFEINTALPFEVKAAVCFANQAQFNAAKYCTALARMIDGDGSYIFEESRALSIHDGQNSRVMTKNSTVHARHIIVATNVPTFPLMARGGYCLLEYPQTSYLIAVRAKKNPKGMYISIDNNEYSILPVDHGQNRLVLIGGEGHIRGAKLNKRTRYQRLANYAEQRFGATSVEFMWHAWDYGAYDNIPLVGKMYPWSQNLYVITAFRKWGLSNSMVAGIIVRDLITEKQNEWAQVYNPMRATPIKSIPRVIKQHIFD